MKSQVRHTALLAAGALAGGAAAALGISSKAWFGSEKPVAAAVSSMTTGADPVANDSAPVSASAITTAAPAPARPTRPAARRA